MGSYGSLLYLQNKRPPNPILIIKAPVLSSRVGTILVFIGFSIDFDTFRATKKGFKDVIGQDLELSCFCFGCARVLVDVL